MELSVMNRQEAANSARPGRYEGIVSINDPGMKMPWEVKNLHEGLLLPLYFYDISKPLPNNTPPFEVARCKLPTRKDAEKIINFARLLPEDAKVMTHCYAGISRSSAAAIIILATRYDREETTQRIKQLVEEYPWIYPNQLLINYAAKIIEVPWLEEAVASAIGPGIYGDGWKPLTERKVNGTKE